jgi:hypothetical protein
VAKTPPSQGKGDRYRPVKGDTFRANWDIIFSKKPGQMTLKGCTKAIRAKRKPLVTCAAARDGECHHPDCPQIRDNEPEKRGRHCPIDTCKDPYEEAT